MKRLVAFLLLALAATPHAGALRAPEPYPDALEALAPGVVARVEALGEGHEGKPWWPQAKAFLDSARESAQAGRLRATLYDVETFDQVVAAHALVERVNATGGSETDRRVALLRELAAWREASNASWASFRARLHEADGQLRSVQALETVVYAADVGLAAMVRAEGFDALAQRFATMPGLPFDYVLALAGLARAPQVNLALAEEILDVGIAQDGVPPALDAAQHANVTARALRLIPFEEVPAHLRPMESVMRAPRENGEALLALAGLVGEQGAIRLYDMEGIYGDARSRGKDAVRDADRSFLKQLNNTTLEASRKYGLQGVFVADAVDAGLATQEVVDAGQGDLGLVLATWSNLDRANFASAMLATMSTVVPPTASTPTATSPATPGPGLALVILAAAGGLLLARRRA